MQIRWTKNAVLNLDEIESYIKSDNPQAAIATVLKIIRSVEQLSRHPAMGRPGRVEETRELVIAQTPFIVPYRVKNNAVEILRVFHSAQKWSK